MALIKSISGIRGTIGGKPINAIISLSVSTRTEFEKRSKSKASTPEMEVETVEDLFD